MRRIDHRMRGAGLATIAALGLILLLTATVWAAWGVNGHGLVFHLRGLSGALQADLTATPTRTPRPLTPEPTPIPVDLAIVAPAATRTPVPANTPEPATSPTSLPGRLAEVVRRYGIDPVRRFVVVDIASQTMAIWDPPNPVRELPVSTGDETRGYRTPAWYGLVGNYVGTFSAFGVYADEGWYLFEDIGKILVHGAPYRLADGAKVYEDMDALGSYPASRGCIRLSPEDARWFTEWEPKGVPLVILPGAADD